MDEVGGELFYHRHHTFFRQFIPAYGYESHRNCRTDGHRSYYAHRRSFFYSRMVVIIFRPHEEKKLDRRFKGKHTSSIIFNREMSVDTFHPSSHIAEPITETT